MQYKLTTISNDESASKDVYDQLTTLIGKHFIITSYCYQDYLKIKHPKDKLVLITGPLTEAKVIHHLNRDCKYFIGKRTLNPKSFHLLFNIPKDSEVLVVNNLYENAIEVITELQAVGINHLRLFAHDPHKPLEKKFRYAISHGELHLVPPDIPHVINLGRRLISLMSIAQIVDYCTGDRLDDSFLYERYIRDLVKLSFESFTQIQRNDLLQEQMKMVLANFEDGILVTEADNKITFHNTIAASILNQKTLIGKSLSEVNIPSSYASGLDAIFVNIADKTIHTARKEVALGKDRIIQMITLKDLTNIRKIDEEYKTHKKHAAYTAKYTFKDIIHQSTAMANTVRIAKQLAQSESTILITGESGTGKELIAQSIHNASKRKSFPFVAINCAALSESLLESELFGYEEGAFTGAKKGGKQGIFELADDGTIFLDEIGDAPLSIQNKLLRVLQEKEMMRVSGNKVIPINVRVIAATNKDLFQMVEQGLFRQDLYYRLHVLPLSVPPLRDRKEDIELLAPYLLSKHGAHPTPADMEIILSLFYEHSWPGNIRELENIAEYISTIGAASQDLKGDILRLINRNQDKKNLSPVDTAARKALFSRSPQIKTDLVNILQLLSVAKSEEVLLGRYKLQQLLQSKNVCLTPQQVKTRLDMLHQAGFIATQTGKGSILTEAGAEYLCCLQKEKTE